MIRIDEVQGIGLGEIIQLGGDTVRVLTILTRSGNVQMFLHADDRHKEPALTVRRRLQCFDQDKQSNQNPQDQQETSK